MRSVTLGFTVRPVRPVAREALGGRDVGRSEGLLPGPATYHIVRTLGQFGTEAPEASLGVRKSGLKSSTMAPGV